MRNQSDKATRERRHYIAEWAELRDKKQADIVRDLDVSKSMVYRWLTEDVIPSEKHLTALADYLQVDDVISLFRHPDDDWFAKMFRDKTEEQKEAAIQMLKLFFSQSDGARRIPDPDKKKRGA